MPVLHQYKDRDGYYVLTSINGAIITFQLTNEGKEKLTQAGINPEDKFGRLLLLDLYRSGNAYTFGSGPGVVGIKPIGGQLEFDFSQDSEAEKMFPQCSGCKSLDDLHIVELKGSEPSLDIKCSQCRSKDPVQLNSSIPLPFLTRSTLNQFIQIRGIKKIYKAVKIYQNMLDAEFEEFWQRVKIEKVRKQPSLLVSDGKQKKLI